MDEARASLDGFVADQGNTLPAVIGRPKLYNGELADKICEAIGSGMKMKDVAKLPGFPGRSTVFGWLRIHDDFRIAYDGAMQWRAEEDADWLMELATDSADDHVDEEVGNEGETRRVLDKTAIARSELACKYLWKLMERRSPKKYGPPVEPVIMPPAAPGAPQPGDDAKWIGGVIEGHPLQASIEAYLTKP